MTIRGLIIYVIKDTLARVSEVNRLECEDIDLDNRTITLKTRKKKGVHGMCL
jgi:integrase